MLKSQRVKDQFPVSLAEILNLFSTMGCCSSIERKTSRRIRGEELSSSDEHDEKYLPNAMPSAPPLYAEAVVVAEPEGDSHMITINIRHVSGVADRDGEFCLNNIYAIAGNGAFLPHSQDSLFHEWRKQGASFSVECSSKVRFIAFASQDMQSACIQITTPSDLAVPTDAIDTIHWSNGEYAFRPWGAECNEDATKWAYTVIPLYSNSIGMDESEIRSSFHASWGELNNLRSSGF